MKKIFIIIATIGLAAGLGLGISSDRFQSWWADVTKPELPAAENINQSVTNTTTNGSVNAKPANANTAIPSAKNLAIPFTTQAPDANWDADHEEFCEEAAMLMVGRYFQGRGFSSTTDQESGLQAIKKWEVENLGFYFDTTAAENKQIIEGLYGLHVDLLFDPTVQQIQAALVAGHPVIVPSAGRELGNPNFKSPGPIYHNLVIRGYTAGGKFITNDPGTRKGEEYVYDEDVIMSAIHDWVPRGDRTIAANGDVSNGQRVVLVVSAQTE